MPSPGEAGVSQAQQEGLVSGPLPGLPQAVHIGGADQSAGAPETPQRPLSHQNSGQQQRVQVGIARRSSWLSVRVCVCVCQRDTHTGGGERSLAGVRVLADSAH